MANAWDISDAFLVRQLEAIVTACSGDDVWSLHLYQNDYTPIPGSTVASYTESSFPGYLADDLDPAEWGSVSVVDHVAITVNSLENVFTANSSGFSSQPVYGYYVLDGVDAYVWGERFATMRTMLPGDELKITPEMRQKTAPA